MKYQSTRNSNIRITSAEAIKEGLAPDGGLYVPEEFPPLSKEELQSMLDMTYQGRAKLVLKKYLTDFTDAELEHCIVNAYGSQFENAAIAPTVKFADGQYICELWHGPTSAFKDMALQILPYLLKESIRKTGEDKCVVILVATSGDTGKAALEGFKNVEGTKIIVFYPENGVSEIQKLQMVTQEGSNVSVFAIQGNFDATQTGVKKIFSDKELAKELLDRGYVFSSANSINFGRLVPQIVYYFSAYLDMVNRGAVIFGEKVNFTVPTGNFGNILAAFYAKQMGLPVNKLICASNKNNILSDFIKSGVYNINREFYLTSSPSMDILISSNLERLLYELSGKNAQFVKDLMAALAKDGVYKVDDTFRKKLQKDFYGDWISDEAVLSVIADAKNKYSYIPDTHTAVGIGVYQNYREATGDTTPTVIMSTASPFKFCKDVLFALGCKSNEEGTRLLEKLSDEFKLQIPAGLRGLDSKPVRFTGASGKDEMKTLVDHTLR